MLFLGQWCCRYRRRDAWQNLDVVLAMPYGLGQASKDADRLAARALEKAVFADFVAVLNQHHDLQESQRYWQIILGHWFRRCIDIVFNRVRTLQQCLDEQQPEATIVLTNHNYSLATQDSYAAIWAANDDRWNHELYKRVLELFPQQSLDLQRFKVDGPTHFFWQYGIPGATARGGIRASVIACQQAVDKRLNRRARVHVQNSYLPRAAELRLQLLLGQFPRLPVGQIPAPTAAIDHNLRGNLATRLARSEKSEVEDIVRALIFEMLPTCFLEGFGMLRALSDVMQWPAAPDKIFTSNNFDTDEVFKVWAAGKVNKGARYVLGQHGNNYGTHRHLSYPSVEEEIADHFLTWGWTDGLRQHTPAFIFKTAGRPRRAYSPTGGLLLIEVSAPNRIFTWDTEAEFAEYLGDQQRFLSALKPAPRAELNIRLHSTSAFQDWAEVERWASFDPALKVDSGESSMSDLIANSRLIVHSYDSTGILECLAQDVPMIAFWRNGLEHVRDSARQHYQVLVDAGVLHLTADSAAEKVNSIWHDVSAWWRSPDVVAARSAFCSRYAVSCDIPARRMRQILDRL